MDPLASSGNPTTSQEGEKSPSNTEKEEFNNAVNYLNTVKRVYGDNPRVYKQFLTILQDYYNDVINTPHVVQCITRLFDENPQLIQGINDFLPAGYQIDLSAGAPEINTAHR